MKSIIRNVVNNKQQAWKTLKRVQGFTLIELLVVVLVIGILAAVALPQYQKAVMKSRYAKLKPIVQTLANAEEVYYLANGEYTPFIEELDVDFPETPNTVTTGSHGDTNYGFDWGYCSLNANISPHRVVCSDSSLGMTYARILRHQTEYVAVAGMQRCAAGGVTNNPTLKHQICQSESGLSEPNAPDNPAYGDYYW